MTENDKAVPDFNANREHIIKNHLYPWLKGLGLEQNREKFILADAGHRGYSIDVGAAYGEIKIRVVDRTSGNTLTETFVMTSWEQVRTTIEAVELLVTRKKVELGV